MFICLCVCLSVPPSRRCKINGQLLTLELQKAHFKKYKLGRVAPLTFKPLGGNATPLKNQPIYIYLMATILFRFN